MSHNKLFDLICTALPQGFNVDILRQFYDEKLATIKENKACLQALNLCPAIDWQAYLEHYPNVKKRGLDPILHFLQDGIFEGQRLYTKNFVRQSEDEKNRPKVSVIIANYNNALFLDKTLDSVCTQTLKDIEIIFMDDASTDNSVEIAAVWAKKYSNIKIYRLKINSSQHMARKAGVALATGEYIMFLDSDDYYYADACEEAYKAISKGYDIVTFGASVCNYHSISKTFQFDAETFLNGGAEKEYLGAEIPYAMFELNAPCRTLWCKIYNAELAKEAFAQMEDGHFPVGEDIYEIAALVAKAEKMFKINKKLYAYRMGVGKTTTSDTAEYAAGALTAASIAEPLKRMLQKTGHYQYYENLLKNIYERAVKSFIFLVQPDDITEYFNNMASKLGIINILEICRELPAGMKYKLAELFHHYRIQKQNTKSVKSVGILYSRLVNGGAENVIMDMAEMLVREGYEVTFFLCAPFENDIKLPNKVRVCYLARRASGANAIDILQSMLTILTKRAPDVMLSHEVYGEDTLWHVLLLKYLQIPVILFPHSAFTRRLCYPGNELTMDVMTSILRCADKVAAISRYANLYYNICGINSCYIPNPVRYIPENDLLPEFKSRNNNIIVSGRLDEQIKQIDQCLNVLKELCKIDKSIKMIFIGSFLNKDTKNKFYKKVKESKLTNNIQVTGWLESSIDIIDNSKILFSASWTENFPLSIAEAQARGLPVVMYNIPIDVAQGNPSVICVPQGNYQKAAEEILLLMKNEDKWQKLSNLAKKIMKQYTLEIYIDKIIRLLKTFDKSSDLTDYNAEDYREVMRAIAFYGTHMPPWVGS